jgi:hypothetical protein
MEDLIDRFLLIVEAEDIKMPWLEAQTGIKAKRWHTIKQGKEMRTSELGAFNKIFPEYAVWLNNGFEIPEAGHISPMTKRAHTSSKTAPKAG